MFRYSLGYNALASLLRIYIAFGQKYTSDWDRAMPNYMVTGRMDAQEHSSNFRVRTRY